MGSAQARYVKNLKIPKSLGIELTGEKSPFNYHSIFSERNPHQYTHQYSFSSTKIHNGSHKAITAQENGIEGRSIQAMG